MPITQTATRIHMHVSHPPIVVSTAMRAMCQDRARLADVHVDLRSRLRYLRYRHDNLLRGSVKIGKAKGSGS